MPRLKLIAACEKVIVDQAGSASLIGIFQRVILPLPEAPLPERAISLNRWSVFCLWENDLREMGQEFVQIVRVFAPDGSLFGEHEAGFKNELADNLQTRMGVQFPAMPMWVEGNADIKVFLKGDDTELGSYRFAIRYMPVKYPTTASGVAV